LKRLLNNPGALVTTWFVVVVLVVGLVALAYLQPPPPAGGDAVTVALPPAEPAAEEDAPAAETSPPEAAPGGPPALEAPAESGPPTPPPAEVTPPEPPLPPPQAAPDAAPAEPRSSESQSPESQSPEPQSSDSQAAVRQAPQAAAAPERVTEGEGAAAPSQEALVHIPVIPPAPEQLPYWERYRQPFNMDDKRPRIAVVLTGLGLSDGATQAAIERLPAAVTLSFSPYARDLERWIALARARGHEVMLDLPMEPTTFPNDDPGPQALLISLSPQANLDRLDWVLGRGSAYVGIAGSMGSRFTASRDAIEPILREVKERGLLFLDRRTTEESLVAALAEEIGLPHAVNNRSVDERQASRVAIDARLAQIERIALTDGAAVAMAQPYPVTLERLAEWTAELTARGFAIAPISAVASLKKAP
jgi:polysaccharide deacetylase 2 family uncharacterized protein YibQ